MNTNQFVISFVFVIFSILNINSLTKDISNTEIKFSIWNSNSFHNNFLLENNDLLQQLSFVPNERGFISGFDNIYNVEHVNTKFQKSFTCNEKTKFLKYLNYIDINFNVYKEEVLFVIIILFTIIVLFKIKIIPVKTQAKNKKNAIYMIKFMFIMLFAHTFEEFDSRTGTLTIYSQSDFDQMHKSETKNVVIKDGITEIPQKAFDNWTLLENVDIGNTVTVIREYAFQLCPFASINIPNSVNIIERYVFLSCKSLLSIVIPESVYSLGEGVFQICDALSSVVIPNNISQINFLMFYYCTVLTDVIIGRSVTSIGQFAFFMCKSLKCFYFYGDSSPTIDSAAFQSAVTSLVVMTTSTYKDSSFGTFDINKETVISGCDPWPTNTFTSSFSFTQSSSFTKSNTLTQTNSFTQYNTNMNSNTFIKSNTPTKSNVYIKSEIFSDKYLESNSAMEISSFDETITFSFYTYSCSITETIISISSTTNTITLSEVDSSFTYISTVYIYYQYKVIAYSSYYPFYSYFKINGNENLGNNKNNSTIIAVGVCVPIAVILIIILMVILLIRKKKKESTVEYEEGEIQHYDTNSLNNFSTGLSIANAEEDPFAADFKENEHFVSI